VPTDSFLDSTYAGIRAVLDFAPAGGIDLASSRQRVSIRLSFS
jgi:hypothetical protein